MSGCRAFRTRSAIFAMLMLGAATAQALPGDDTSRLDFALYPESKSPFGVALSMSSRAPSAPGFLPPSTTNAVDIGLQWRHTFEGRHRMDITAWRRLAHQDALPAGMGAAEPLYGARVEMHLAPAPAGRAFVADKGFVGFQLEGGARITVKRRDGRPMVYYRKTF